MYRIAHNLLIDHVRAVKPVDSLSIDEDEPDAQANLLGPQTAEPDSELLRSRQVAWLKECIGLLPQVQKEAFLLNQESGLTAQLISEVAGATLEPPRAGYVMPIRACVTVWGARPRRALNDREQTR